MQPLLERIAELAEALRAATFVKAAEFVLSVDRPVIIETGSFRGCTGDGQSTVILAMLAKQQAGLFHSFELNQAHIDIAIQHLKEVGLENHVDFIQGDSCEKLKQLPDGITFAYLDSYDYEEAKAIDSQTHQLKEAEILLPKMAARSAFLLDDCDLPLGGKGGLSVPLILANGFKEVMSQYQRMFVRE